MRRIFYVAPVLGLTLVLALALAGVAPALTARISALKFKSASPRSSSAPK